MDASRLILKDLKPKNKGNITKATVQGKVAISEGSIVKDGSAIKGPAIVGRNCLISNAYIGPYTSIGDGCRVINTEIEDSIIMEGTQIADVQKIVGSLIGKNVTIKGSESLLKGLKLIIGDDSEVRI